MLRVISDSVASLFGGYAGASLLSTPGIDDILALQSYAVDRDKLVLEGEKQRGQKDRIMDGELRGVRASR